MDGQHPNDLGFYWIAEGLVPFLRQALRLPGSEVIASPADLKTRIPAQLRITKPDYVVFVPAVTDAEVNDTGNEHFLVFDGPKKSLMAVWTQSSAEAARSAHHFFAKCRRGQDLVQASHHRRPKNARRRQHGKLGLSPGQQDRARLCAL